MERTVERLLMKTRNHKVKRTKKERRRGMEVEGGKERRRRQTARQCQTTGS
jgi:hypothetical protein